MVQHLHSGEAVIVAHGALEHFPQFRSCVHYWNGLSVDPSMCLGQMARHATVQYKSAIRQHYSIPAVSTDAG